MAYTLKQLTLAWSAVHNGVAPDADTTAELTQLAAGSLTNAEVLSTVLNSADDTTTVALLSYQFFTGKSPTKAGLDYLLNSAANPNDLNDPYYAKFNLENRYINFAANLGVNGEGATAFAAKYGAMSFDAYVASIYDTIIGKDEAKAAGVDVTAAIAYLVGTKDAVLAIVTDAGMVTATSTPAQIDLAVKAAMAGLVMAAAIKADIGLYAAAANNFMLAQAQGDAVYNTDMLGHYGPDLGLGSTGGGKAVDVAPADLPGGPTSSGPSYLTLTGTAHDDVFNVTGKTIGRARIDGLGGNDTLHIDSTSSRTLTVEPTRIRDVETVEISNGGGVVVDTTTWTGLTTLDVTSSGLTDITANDTTDVGVAVHDQGGEDVFVTGHDVTVLAFGATDGNVNVAASGDIVIQRDIVGDGPSGLLAVLGGVHVDISLTTTTPLTGEIRDMGLVGVIGWTTTEDVRIIGPAALADDGTNGEILPAVIIIQDYGYISHTSPGTIESVEVDGFDSLEFGGANLKTLIAAHGGQIYIKNVDGLTTPEATTLDVTLNDVHGVLDDDGVYDTLHMYLGPDLSEIDLGMDGVKTLTVDGTGKVWLVADPLYTSHIETVAVGSDASLTADLSGQVNLTQVTTTTTGTTTVIIDGDVTAYDGGAGVDQIIFSGVDISQAIDLGDGDDRVDLASGANIPTVTIAGGLGTDTLALDAETAENSATIVNKFTGFERLVLAHASNQSISLDLLGFHHVTTSGGSTLFLSGLASGDTLVLDGEGTSYALNGAWTGGADSLFLGLQDKTGAGVSFGSLNTSGLEALNITIQDDSATPAGAMEALTLVGSGLETIVVSGDAGLALTSTLTGLTTVDASGITVGDFSWTSGALSGAVTVKGSASGTNTVDLSAATDQVSYIGGSGDDDVIVANGAHGIDVGSGFDRVTITAVDPVSEAVYPAITGLDSGDQLDLGAFSNADALGAELTGESSVADYLALANDVAGTTNTLHWFALLGDIYIVADADDSPTFQPGTDAVIRLVGAATAGLDPSLASVSDGVITFG